MKIVHANWGPTSLKVLLGVLMAVVFTVAANAQPSFVGKFTLAHEVHWGKPWFQPGSIQSEWIR